MPDEIVVLCLENIIEHNKNEHLSLRTYYKTSISLVSVLR